MKENRRRQPQLVAVGLLLMALVGAAGAFAQAQIPLPGSAIPQFVDPLPPLDVIADNGTQITLDMREFQAPVLSTGTFVPGVAPLTWVWGYLQPNEVGVKVPRPSYLGPVIVATRGQPTEIKYANNLGTTASTNVLAYKLSTDQTLHWADPWNGEMNMGNHSLVKGALPMAPWDQNYSGPIPAVPHLHGGEVPPVLDGGPDAWFTSDGNYHGHGYYTMMKKKKPAPVAGNEAIYRYPNSQEAAPIWFHDHTLGATRLNVYAGLAGGYLITDPPNDPANLPPLVPLVVQDRMFDTNGQLFFPAGIPYILNPEHQFWVPEFVGDSIVVNGKTWPYLNVEPKRYRFIMINGSNARTYELFLINQTTGAAGPSIWQIGTDGGYLDAPALVKKLLLMPGERADFIVDFAGLAAGTQLILRNTAKTPYPAGASPQGGTLGRIMQFRIVPLTAADSSFNPAVAGAKVRTTPIPRLTDPVAGTVAAGIVVNKIRQLTLNEIADPPVVVGGVAYPGGPTEILVNNTRWDGLSATSGGPGQPDVHTPRPDFTAQLINGVTEYLSEIPSEGAIEQWEIVNLTADAHPIHTHLVQFQILNRQAFDVNGYNAAYAAAFPALAFMPGYGPPLDYATGNPRAVGGNPDIVPFLKGKLQPPAANEAGWKDTFMVPPGMVSRFVVRWAPIELGTNIDPAQYKYPFNPNAGGHGYVWHCHIIDHEDNEMMRPTSVTPMAGALRTYVQGVDY